MIFHSLPHLTTQVFQECEGLDAQTCWQLAEPRHRDGTAVLEFLAPQTELERSFEGGARAISLSWDQKKISGCALTAATTCDDHNWLFYFLFLVVLFLICAGTYLLRATNM